MFVTAPIEHSLPDLSRFAPRKRYANHNLDSMRWAVMGSTYTAICSICEHQHSPDYGRDIVVDDKQVWICPDCMHELRTGDVESFIADLHAVREE